MKVSYFLRVLFSAHNQFCRECGGEYPGREGTGSMFWFTCNRCRARIAAEQRADTHHDSI